MNRLTDAKLETAIGQVLRAGVCLAAGVVIVGAALFLSIAAGSPRPDYRHFQPGPAALSSVHAIVANTMKGDGASIIQFGLLLLIATPIVRVAVALVGFLLEHDWLYSAVSATVFFILMYSVVFGR